MTAPSRRRRSSSDGAAAPTIGYREVLRRHGVLVLAGLLIGLGAGAVLAAELPARYASETTLYTTARVAPGDPDAAYSATQLEQQKAKFYVAMITGPGLGAEVAPLLGGDVDPATLSADITAQVPTDSPIIMITASGRTPEQARAIADAAGRALVAVAADVEAAPGTPGSPTTTLRVVQPASDPASTSVPTLLVVVLGAVLGLLAGGLAALTRHALDRSVRSPDELAEVTGRRTLEVVALGRRPVDDPARSEAFRRLRTTLGFLGDADEHHVLAVTGAAAGEGTTTVVVDLARAIARTGRSVVVVDTSLRRPGLTERLGLEPADGLDAVLSGRLPLDVAVQAADGGRLDVLVGGPLPPASADVLGSRTAGALVAALRERYDRILLDTSPITEIADAAAVVGLADAALLVVRRGGAARERVAEAASRARDTGTPLLGSVLVTGRRTPSRPGPDAAVGHGGDGPDEAGPATSASLRSLTVRGIADPEHRDGERLADR